MSGPGARGRRGRKGAAGRGQTAEQRRIETFLAVGRRSTRATREAMAVAWLPWCRRRANYHALRHGRDVDELLSASMMAVIRAAEWYEPDGGASVENFAWRAQHRACMTAARTLRKWDREAALRGRRVLSLHDAVGDADGAPRRVLDLLPAPAAARRDNAAIAQLAMVRAAVETLSPAARQLLDRRHRRGMTLRECGAASGTSGEAARQRLETIYRTLRRTVGAMERAARAGRREKTL